MAVRKTIFDDVDETIEDTAITEAHKQIDAGQGISHDVVGKWLLKLARGEPAKPTFLHD